VPPLGRHYSESWEDQDRYALDLPILERPSGNRVHNPYSAFTDPPPPSAGGSLQPVVNSGLRWDPATLTEGDAVTEEHGSGPLTERIFSAFLHIPNNNQMEEDDSYKGGPGLGRAAGQGTVGDLEERLMKECKALGLVLENEEVSSMSRVDTLTGLHKPNSQIILSLKTTRLPRSSGDVSGLSEINFKSTKHAKSVY